jgi:protein gp37
VSDKTGIEWTDRTLNIVTGCTKVSDGCLHCYIERTPPLRMAGRKFDKPGIGGSIGLMFHMDRLAKVVRATKPRRWFVNSLADLFHADVPRDVIVQLWAAMALAPQHTFQILTKRHDRMRNLIADECKCGSGHMDGIHFRSAMAWAVSKANPNRPDWAPDDAEQRVYSAEWPLRNVWLGVSVEDQKAADLRIPALLETPAAVRWLSCEPLLGPVDLHGPVDRFGGRPHLTYWLTGQPHWVDDVGSEPRTSSLAIGPKIDWVVVGGESGPGARPMHPDWARTLRDQCADSGVPYLFKQWGAWAPAPPVDARPGDVVLHHDGTLVTLTADGFESMPVEFRRGAYAMRRVGKKSAGRELDGRTWDQYPVVTA